MADRPPSPDPPPPPAAGVSSADDDADAAAEMPLFSEGSVYVAPAAVEARLPAAPVGAPDEVWLAATAAAPPRPGAAPSTAPSVRITAAVASGGGGGGRGGGVGAPPALLLADGHPLHSWARVGDTVRVGALLAAGADVNARDEWDATPLYYASLCGHVPAVRALLDGGATCDAASFDGERIFYAALTAQVQAVLLDYTHRVRPRGEAAAVAHLRRLWEVANPDGGPAGRSASTAANGGGGHPPASSAADLTLIVHGVPLHLHRFVLAGRIPGFRRRLAGRWAGTPSVALRRAALTPPAAAALLEWAYGGFVDVPAGDDAASLVAAARGVGCEGVAAAVAAQAALEARTRQAKHAAVVRSVLRGRGGGGGGGGRLVLLSVPGDDVRAGMAEVAEALVAAAAVASSPVGTGTGAAAAAAGGHAVPVEGDKDVAVALCPAPWVDPLLTPTALATDAAVVVSGGVVFPCHTAVLDRCEYFVAARRFATRGGGGAVGGSNGDDCGDGGDGRDGRDGRVGRDGRGIGDGGHIGGGDQADGEAGGTAAGGRPPPVEFLLRDVPPAVFAQVLHFLYTGRLRAAGGGAPTAAATAALPTPPPPLTPADFDGLARLLTVGEMLLLVARASPPPVSGALAGVPSATAAVAAGTDALASVVAAALAPRLTAASAAAALGLALEFPLPTVRSAAVAAVAAAVVEAASGGGGVARAEVAGGADGGARAFPPGATAAAPTATASGGDGGSGGDSDDDSEGGDGGGDPWAPGGLLEQTAALLNDADIHPAVAAEVVEDVREVALAGAAADGGGRVGGDGGDSFGGVGASGGLLDDRYAHADAVDAVLCALYGRYEAEVLPALLFVGGDGGGGGEGGDGRRR
ncbi:hypothetical protein I4F81_006837 [Pyropia yezoensis]|uniref:Uncharacterized protein n=1 Tax=Pyropia yezoensis TaxID=2788 RepID=A0ACC3C3D3_PYRYE|nr:hypothetical protein I4F81_006837 [Neopyropia yezoensis]